MNVGEAIAVSPRYDARSGLKLHLAEPDTGRAPVSPCYDAGSGLKRCNSHPAWPAMAVSPRYDAGSGLKHRSQRYTATLLAGLPALRRGERIETSGSATSDRSGAAPRVAMRGAD